jgi:hypothetical protein
LTDVSLNKYGTAARFWIFQRHLKFLVEIKHLLSGKC